MAIEDFLKNLDDKHQEDQEQISHINQERDKKRKEDLEFLASFETYYSKELSREFYNIKKKLHSNFLWEEKSGMLPIQYNSYQITIILTPHFESNIKMITINITASATNRNIQFIGVLPDSMGLKSRVALNYLELNFDDFTKVSFEEEFEKTLNKAFLN